MLFCASSTVSCLTRLHGGTQDKGIRNDNGEMEKAGFYDYTLTSQAVVKIDSFIGKVVLVINTAAGCGFTPQYVPIEQLYRDYHDKGPQVEIEHFVPDSRKNGGAYVSTMGLLTAISPALQTLMFTDGTIIELDDITAIESPLFNTVEDI